MTCIVKGNNPPDLVVGVLSHATFPAAGVLTIRVQDDLRTVTIRLTLSRLISLRVVTNTGES